MPLHASCGVQRLQLITSPSLPRDEPSLGTIPGTHQIAEIHHDWLTGRNSLETALPSLVTKPKVQENIPLSRRSIGIVDIEKEFLVEQIL